MANIVRGTTPTIIFTYRTVEVDEIDKAYLTIKQSNQVLVERDISSATIDTVNNHVEWTLTQTETLNFNVGTSVFISCDWLLKSGTRGRSHVLRCEIEPSGKDEII